jgi:hypothetical protein
MNEEVFWDLISHLNWKENLSNEEIVAPLVAKLHLMMRIGHLSFSRNSFRKIIFIGYERTCGKYRRRFLQGRQLFFFGYFFICSGMRRCQWEGML